MARILICEPYGNLRTLYAHELCAEGYDVELASDVTEAMRKLRTMDADLVVMDISPRSRHRAHEMAVALSRKAGPPVILNAVYGPPPDDLLSIPAHARLTKSCDLGELKQKIRELLAHSRRGQEVEACAW